MNQRSKIILDAFADWSEHCKREYHEKYEDPTILSEIERTDRLAKEAYKQFQATDFLNNYPEWQAAKTNFLQVAERYFRLHIHEGYTSVAHQLSMIEFHDEEWSKLRTQLENCKEQSTLNLLIDEIDRKVESLVAKPEFSPFDEFVTQKSRTVAYFNNAKSTASRSEFGYAATFRDLGEAFALQHFENLFPKRGAPKKFLGNPDTYRYWQFKKIVALASEALEKNLLKPTSTREVCLLVMGEENQLAEFNRNQVIRWALEEYFSAGNITAEGFLNSMSRGKKKRERQEK